MFGQFRWLIGPLFRLDIGLFPCSLECQCFLGSVHGWEPGTPAKLPWGVPKPRGEVKGKCYK